jgi:hypothetical protein
MKKYVIDREVKPPVALTPTDEVHRADLEKSGLTQETIAAAGIKSLTVEEFRAEVGYVLPEMLSAYQIPYGEGFGRYKIIRPNGAQGMPKYFQKKGTGNHLYMPQKTREVLSDSAIPLYITEGEKKALKACQEGLACIALSGLWGWTKGEGQLIGDFDKINFDGRQVYLVPDNDWLSPDKHGYQKNLKQAVERLAAKLLEKKAKVSIVELPKDGSVKIGLDDYLKSHSIEEFKDLPSTEFKTLEERIAGASVKNYKDLLPEIALCGDVEREVYCKRLASALGVGLPIIRKEITACKKETGQEGGEPRIVHPSYDVGHDFLLLGFRETIVQDDTPVDRVFYLIDSDNGLVVVKDSKVFQLGHKKLVFDVRERTPVRLDQRWNKGAMLAFTKNKVAPLGVFGEIDSALREYVEFQEEGHYGLTAAWVIATYFHRQFTAFPFINFYETKGSGKSRILELLERLAFNAMKMKGVTAAALGDGVDATRGTFLVDQAESLSDPNNMSLLGLLTDSYTAGGGKRLIVDTTGNKGRRLTEYDAYSPKAFASTKEIDEDLKDRCIQIRMLKATREYPAAKIDLPIWKTLRDKLYRLMLSNWRAVQEIYPATGGEMQQRVRELWRPIDTVLQLEKVPEEVQVPIREAFRESMTETQVELSEEQRILFRVIQYMLKESGDGVYSISEIVNEWEKEEHTNTNAPDHGKTRRTLESWVGRTVHQYSLFDSASPVRKNGKRAYPFSSTRVEDIWKRYSKVAA